VTVLSSVVVNYNTKNIEVKRDAARYVFSHGSGPVGEAARFLPAQKPALMNQTARCTVESIVFPHIAKRLRAPHNGQLGRSQAEASIPAAPVTPRQ